MAKWSRKTVAKESAKIRAENRAARAKRRTEALNKKRPVATVSTKAKATKKKKADG